MSRKLLDVEELEVAMEAGFIVDAVVELTGDTFKYIGREEGEVGRWTRTDLHVLLDDTGRYWAVPYEVNPSDHEAGADGFRSHAEPPSNTHVAAWEVRPVTVETITWQVVK